MQSVRQDGQEGTALYQTCYAPESGLALGCC